MGTITLKPILIFVCSVICALYLWGHQPLVTAREPSSPALATPQPPHLPISPSLTNPMDTTSQPTLGDHRDGVVSVAFSPDGRLATGETDGMARIWDAQGRLVMTLKASDHGGEPIDRNRGSYPGYIWESVFSPDGTKLATRDSHGILRIRDSQGTLLIEDQGWGIVFSPNSSLVAFIDPESNYLKLWNFQTQQWVEFRDPLGNRLAVADLQFSPDSSGLLIHDGHIELWTTQGQLVADLEAINVAEADKLRNGIWGMTFSPDGSSIIVFDYILDAQGQILGRLEQPRGWGLGPQRFSPDGRKLISRGRGYVRNSQGQLLRQQFSVDGYKFGVTGAFSPDSSRLVTVAVLDDGFPMVRDGFPMVLWNSQGEDLVKVATLEIPEGKVSAMAFSPDSQLLATSDDYAIRLWSRQGQLLKTFPGQYVKPVFSLHSGPGLQFSPDGRRLISHSEDYTVRFWDVSGL